MDDLLDNPIWHALHGPHRSSPSVRVWHAGAISIYRRLGFEVRAEMHYLWRRPVAPADAR